MGMGLVVVSLAQPQKWSKDKSALEIRTKNLFNQEKETQTLRFWEASSMQGQKWRLSLDKSFLTGRSWLPAAVDQEVQ